MKAYTRAGDGWGALYPGVRCSSLPQVNSDCVHRDEICFQFPLEGHTETSNGQALLNPFHHYIKMKEYIKVEWGAGDTLPQGRLSPSTAGKF